MRLLLVLLMLTLLPLQFSAAATDHCCGHLTQSQERQAQHHQSLHLPEVLGTSDLAPDTPVFDLDCGTCHANCAAAVTATIETHADPAGIERGEHRAQPNLPPLHEQPYRPQWPTPQGSGLNAIV